MTTQTVTQDVVTVNYFCSAALSLMCISYYVTSTRKLCCLCFKIVHIFMLQIKFNLIVVLADIEKVAAFQHWILSPKYF